ncbi:MAG: transposase, partial [Deltaproteobacteria bacterium]|nr:transposase [Deltaproteobacteria bacterium]
FAIARRVAKNRILSTVDPESRHGHKTKARSFDGYKGHISEDPDSEIITATVVTPGNAGDGSVAIELLSEVLESENDDDTGASSDKLEEDETSETSAERIEIYGDANVVQVIHQAKTCSTSSSEESCS